MPAYLGLSSTRRPSVGALFCRVATARCDDMEMPRWHFPDARMGWADSRTARASPRHAARAPHLVSVYSPHRTAQPSRPPPLPLAPAPRAPQHRLLCLSALPPRCSCSPSSASRSLLRISASRSPAILAAACSARSSSFLLLRFVATIPQLAALLLEDKLIKLQAINNLEQALIRDYSSRLIESTVSVHELYCL